MDHSCGVDDSVAGSLLLPPPACSMRLRSTMPVVGVAGSLAAPIGVGAPDAAMAGVWAEGVAGVDARVLE